MRAKQPTLHKFYSFKILILILGCTGKHFGSEKNPPISQTSKVQVDKSLSTYYYRAECCLVYISEVILEETRKQEIFSDYY